MDRTECTEALVALGFTALEAEVYAVLVEQSPVSAYKVAQEIGKAAANVYKAVESLQRKGAILVEETSTRLCRAVPPGELIQQLERQFATARTRAQSALARLGRPVGDERVYELRSTSQVLARARGMLQKSERVVLCDLFPEPAAALREDIEAAARRGCLVHVQAYEPIEFGDAVRVFINPDGPRLVRNWPGQWLNVVADAREHLLAFLRRGLEEVHQAVWSESVYLSLLYFSGLSSEMIANAASSILDAEGAPEHLRQAYADVRASLYVTELPGYASLLARFGAPHTAEPKTSASAKKKSNGKRRSTGTSGG